MEASENLARSRHCEEARLLLSQVFSFFIIGHAVSRQNRMFLNNACVENPAQDICINPINGTRKCFWEFWAGLSMLKEISGTMTYCYIPFFIDN